MVAYKVVRKDEFGTSSSDYCLGYAGTPKCRHDGCEFHAICVAVKYAEAHLD